MSDDQSQEVPTKLPLTREEFEQLKATPGFEKIMAFIRHLDEYDDFSAGFMDNFPDKLPRSFPLKLGPDVVGHAIIDWRKIAGKLFGIIALKPKPDGWTEEQYIEILINYFNSLSGNQVSEHMLPTLSTVWHMLEFLPQKINDAIKLLAAEGHGKMIIDRQLKLGVEVKSPAKIADELAKIERDTIKGRLPKLQPTKTKPAWKNENNLRRFAEKVMARQLLCQCMKNVYDRCDFLDDWADYLDYNKEFKLLSADVPPEAITWAIRQIGDDKILARDKEPVPVACEIARRELDLPFQEIQTLNGYYLEGVKLLRDDRRKQKSLAKPDLPSQLSTGEMDSRDSQLSTSNTDNIDSE
ncbi:MAG TPA: hypothetical protein VK557_14175 [Pyrinomonadaceae bacterium]|nr:hypothetical protein [Pyrinomonadaceae bacterium]